MRGQILQAHEVRCLIDTGKVTVRRVVKPKLVTDESLPEENLRRSRPMQRGGYQYMGTNDGVEISLRPLFGLPGDPRFVKETWFGGTEPQDVCYRVQCHCGLSEEDHRQQKGWHPSTRMNQKRSRLTIVNVSTRVEQLQDIDGNGTYDEGVVLREPYFLGSPHKVKGTPKVFAHARDAFADLWDYRHRKAEHQWAANPWVWVGEFEKGDK